MPGVRTSEVTPRQPSYFIGHAGVGLLFRDSEENRIVQENIKALGQEIRNLEPRPKAIIVFSGHFEAGEIHGPGAIEVNVKKQTHIQHDYVNDFHDSHPEVYDYDWPHIDDPQLGTEVWRYLVKAGIKAKRVERGIDHGVWVPFKLAFPAERPLDIPIIQVSTYHGYDLSSQIELGKTLAPLRDQGYLIIGSGMAVHSFASIGEIRRASVGHEQDAAHKRVLKESNDFHNQIEAALTYDTASARQRALLDLKKLPEFKRSHPTVEHLTPLLVVAGTAGEDIAEVKGRRVVEPGMSYLNVRFG